MLTVQKVSLSKSNKQLLEKISFDMFPGSINLLLGESGSGKSTLLRCIAQIESGYCGNILYNDKNLKKMTQNQRSSILSYIAQSYPLFPHLTALENCVQPLKIVRGNNSELAFSKASEAIESLNMAKFASSYPHELSGGQQQRIAIARALALHPKVFLFDEPSSALDPTNTKQLAEILCRLASNGKTIVISTQDMSFAKLFTKKETIYLT